MPVCGNSYRHDWYPVRATWRLRCYDRPGFERKSSVRCERRRDDFTLSLCPLLCSNLKTVVVAGTGERTVRKENIPIFAVCRGKVGRCRKAGFCQKRGVLAR